MLRSLYVVSYQIVSIDIAFSFNSFNVFLIRPNLLEKLLLYLIN